MVNQDFAFYRLLEDPTVGFDAKEKGEIVTVDDSESILKPAEILLAQVEALRIAEDHAKRANQTRSAENFNPIPLFHPSEPDLSRVLAFLLNPQESHDQGTLFLSAFCRTIQSCRSCSKSRTFPDGAFPPILSEETQTAVEYAVPEGRFDILLRDGDTCLVIENKPWAAEGQDQLARYASRLEKSAPGNWWLVFLCDRKPISLPKDDDHRRRILRLSFADLADSLLEAAAHVGAVRVSSFVEIFADHLKRQIAGITPMNDSPLLELLKDPKNLPSARRIAEAYKALRPAAWGQFTEYLRMESSRRYGDAFTFYATPVKDFGKEWLYIWFTPKGADNWCLCFADEAPDDMNRFFWGIAIEDNQRFLFDKRPELAKALRTMVTKRFGTDNSRGSNRYWAWYRWGSNGKGLPQESDFPLSLESDEYLPMMFASEETQLSRMIFAKVDAVRDALRDDPELRKIALLPEDKV